MAEEVPDHAQINDELCAIRSMSRIDIGRKVSNIKIRVAVIFEGEKY